LGLTEEYMTVSVELWQSYIVDSLVLSDIVDSLTLALTHDAHTLTHDAQYSRNACTYR